MTEPTPLELPDTEPKVRFWLGMWALLITGLIVAVNALLVWSGTYTDSFRELSTLAITGVLAAAGTRRNN